MRLDLLRLVADESEITNVIILTHNIDFVFVQNLVLRSLAKCGSPSLTIFADAGCAAEMFSLQQPLLANLGRRYRVVPVAMAHGFRFHPKAVLLAGRKSARLLVGSGNLTFSGWRENGEIWVRFRSEDGTAEIAAFKTYLDGLVERLSLNDSLKDEIEEAFDPATRAWAQDLDEPAGLLGRVGSGPALLETVMARIGSAPCEGLVVTSPYFDEDAQALVGLHTAMGSPRTTVFVDPRHTNLRADAAKSLPMQIEIRPAWIERSDGKGPRRCFLHAKLYAVERGDEVVALIGSANCSKAALTLQGNRGNAELLATVRLKKREFDALIGSELTVGSQDELNLPGTAEDSGTTVDPLGPFLLAARADDEVLKLAHSHPGSFQVRRAILDDDRAEVVALDGGACECLCPTGKTPRVVALEGEWQGSPYRTPPLWIDHEKHLLSTAYRRSFEETVRQTARHGSFEIGHLRQVLEVFCQDLEYTSPGRGRPTGGSRNRNEGARQPIFTKEHLFSRDMGLHLSVRNEDHVTRSSSVSIQTLLLRWFGHNPSIEVQPSAEDSTENSGDPEADENELDEPVDRVEPIVSRRRPTKEERDRAKQEERDRKKVRKMVEQTAASMGSPSYLEARRLEDLGRDLQIAAVLLRLGTTKGWLDHGEMLSATHRIWTSLFLSAGNGDTEGWLYRRWQEDPTYAQNVLARPAVTAALFVWSLEIPLEPSTPRHVQMLLALALSVARHPWLWLSSDRTAVAEEVEAILAAATDAWSSDSIESRWLNLLRVGRSLRRLEDTIRQEGMSQLRERNLQENLAAGELVWQGGTLGYCVLKEPASRAEEKKVEVLLVQTGTTEDETMKLRSDFLNPVRGLADCDPSPEGEDMQHLVEFLRSVSDGVADTG